jgi:DNA repair exonuclease SbcCD nuclease subunit
MKFLHLSDSHLGESMPLYRTPPNNWRGESFVKNYYRALKPALEGEVDFVLHAGDLFDKYHINMDIIGRAMVPLRQIAKRNIPVFIVPGNHEREHIPGGLLLAGENIHIFSKPEVIDFAVRNQKVSIVGFPFIRRNSRITFKKIIEKTGWKRRKDALSILLCHQTFEGAKVGTRNFTFRNGEHVVQVSDIPAGFAYVACGHVHKQQIIKAHNTIICYAGSTERVSFQEMHEDKGFYIVEVRDGIAHPSFKKLPSTRMEIISLDTTGKTAEEIIRSIDKHIEESKSSTILRFHLHGEIDAEKLRVIPLYLYKRKREDIRVEFRKDDLVILKDRKKRFYSTKAGDKKVPPAMPLSISVDDKKVKFAFTRAGLADVPTKSGVYILLNKDDRVLYIGKTKNLRSRLLSHLRKKEKGNDGFYFWLQQTKKCDIVTTEDELSALFLEMSLIRGDLPPYNRQIKEFRNYVYIVVKQKEFYPTIRVIDELKEDRNLYFGPFRKEYRIRDGIKLLREIFRIRPCRRNLDESLRLFSCTRKELGTCDAPCTGGVSPSEYQQRVERLLDFLRGADDSIIEQLEKERTELAKIEEFEKAGVLQQTITNLSILFNMLRRIKEASTVSGMLRINFGNGKKKKFPVRSGRVIWEQAKAKESTFDFPPRKWELDEMMLIKAAAEKSDPAFIPEKQK